MENDEINNKIKNDPDFIVSPRYKNSLKELELNEDDGVKDKTAAIMLNMELDVFLIVYAQIIEKIKQYIVPNS